MNWIVYPLFVAFMWAIIDIIDKHVIDIDLKDPLVCTTIFGFTSFFLFSIMSLFYGNPYNLSKLAIFILILAGIIYSISGILYYSSFKREKVSLLVPLFPLRALFVTVFSFIVLREVLSTFKYLGIFVIIIGSILITYKKGVKYKLSFAVLLTIASVFLRAIRDVFIKYVSNIGAKSIFDILFWLFFGCFIVSGVIFIFHHPHIISKSKKGIKHVVLNNIFVFINLGVYFYAISKYSVSLVSAVSTISSLILFFMVLALTKFMPIIICEKFTKTQLSVNFLATIFVVIGAILILV